MNRFLQKTYCFFLFFNNYYFNSESRNSAIEQIQNFDNDNNQPYSNIEENLSDLDTDVSFEAQPQIPPMNPNPVHIKSSESLYSRFSVAIIGCGTSIIIVGGIMFITIQKSKGRNNCSRQHNPIRREIYQNTIKQKLSIKLKDQIPNVIDKISHDDHHHDHSQLTDFVQLISNITHQQDYKNLITFQRACDPQYHHQFKKSILNVLHVAYAGDQELDLLFEELNEFSKIYYALEKQLSAYLKEEELGLFKKKIKNFLDDSKQGPSVTTSSGIVAQYVNSSQPTFQRIQQELFYIRVYLLELKINKLIQNTTEIYQNESFKNYHIKPALDILLSYFTGIGGFNMGCNIISTLLKASGNDGAFWSFIRSAIAYLPRELFLPFTSMDLLSPNISLLNLIYQLYKKITPDVCQQFISNQSAKLLPENVVNIVESVSNNYDFSKEKGIQNALLTSEDKSFFSQACSLGSFTVENFCYIIRTPFIQSAFNMLGFKDTVNGIDSFCTKSISNYLTNQKTQKNLYDTCKSPLEYDQSRIQSSFSSFIDNIIIFQNLLNESDINQSQSKQFVIIIKEDDLYKSIQKSCCSKNSQQSIPSEPYSWKIQDVDNRIKLFSAFTNILGNIGKYFTSTGTDQELNSQNTWFNSFFNYILGNVNEQSVVQTGLQIGTNGAKIINMEKQIANDPILKTVDENTPTKQNETKGIFGFLKSKFLG